jgi:hypothetical protein
VTTVTTRRKTFRGGKKIEDFEPVEFDLNDQLFHCKPALQGAVLLEFVSRADSDEGAQAATALYGFFEDVMEPEEYTRFRDYLKNPSVIIDMETLGDIAAWLIEEYTARPTQPSESSDGGSSSSGLTSTEVPSSVPAAV